MIEDIKYIIISSRKKVAYYGKQLLKELSKELRKILESGFFVSNLQYMRRVYMTYPKQQTLPIKLNWSHYCELLSIENEDERNFYEKECVNSNWSVRELKRQLETSLFERILLSDGKNNKETVYRFSKEGQIINTAEDILKDPYMFEFLDIK